jgi:hypothetical protein
MCQTGSRPLMMRSAALHIRGHGLYPRGDLPKGVRLPESRGLQFGASVFQTQIADVTALACARPHRGVDLNHSGSPADHSSYALPRHTRTSHVPQCRAHDGWPV